MISWGEQARRTLHSLIMLPGIKAPRCPRQSFIPLGLNPLKDRQPYSGCVRKRQKPNGHVRVDAAAEQRHYK